MGIPILNLLNWLILKEKLENYLRNNRLILLSFNSK
jgi:hypothetical protein